MNQRTLLIFFIAFHLLFGFVIKVLHCLLPHLLFALFLSRALSIYAKRYPIQSVTTITCNTILLVVLECYDL